MASDAFESFAEKVLALFGGDRFPALAGGVRLRPEAPVAEVAKKHGVSDQTIYLWRRRFGTMGVDDAKRLKSLEQENVKLKKLLVDRMLDIEVLKDINAKKW